MTFFFVARLQCTEEVHAVKAHATTQSQGLRLRHETLLAEAQEADAAAAAAQEALAVEAVRAATKLYHPLRHRDVLADVKERRGVRPLPLVVAVPRRNPGPPRSSGGHPQHVDGARRRRGGGARTCAGFVRVRTLG